MKKIISKFNIIFLGILILSFSGNYIFASTLVDANKAYNICMKYHPPRIQNLCSQITQGITFEQILGEHNRHGSEEVQAEKENMLPTQQDNTNPTNQDTSNQSDSTQNQEQNNQQEVTKPTQQETSENSQKTNQPTTNKKATPEENKILTFAYSSWFWTWINIVLVAFFVITYIVDRYKYFKRKNKKTKK